MDKSLLASFSFFMQQTFSQLYPSYANKLYLKWFLSYFKEQLNERFLFGHFCWCRRNTNDKYSCKFCIPVERCFKPDYGEINTTGIYSLNSYGRWNENFTNFFQNLHYYSNDMNILHRHCPPKDVIYCYNQLLNYFGKIAVGVYMNLGKRYIFIGNFKQKFFYEKYIEQSRYLFSSIVLNVKKAYIKTAVRSLVPVAHYDPSYLIISNIPYIQYPKKKKDNMLMQTFLIILYNELKKDYPDVELAFYVSRRSRYVHMGSDTPINKLKNIENILHKIQLLWYEKKLTINLIIASHI